MRPGQLFRLRSEYAKHRFCYVKNGKIQNHTSWGGRHLIAVTKNSVIMLVELFAYSNETATVMAMATSLMLETAMATATVTARKEFEETGKIKGFVFLSGDQKIWISHYDLEAFYMTNNEQ